MRGELHPRLVAPWLDARAEVRPLVARHVASCLRCQAEQARYRRLLRLLSQLRAEKDALRPGVLAQIVGAIGVAAENHTVGTAAGSTWRFHRGARLAGGVLAATLVVVAASARFGRSGPSRRGAPASQW